jgi:hypothetical protein
MSYRGILGVLIVAAMSSVALADPIIGWWRMETDTDGGAGFSVPNAVSGSPLNGANGSVQPLNNVGGPQITFFPNLPQPPSPANASGLNGNADINGSIAHYAALDAASITVELFARTQEGAGDLLNRRSGSVGLQVTDFNGLDVLYSTPAGSVTISNNVDFDDEWRHFAFTYDQPTGIGRVFIDGVQTGINDGPDGQALTWPALSALLVGTGMDGGGAFSANNLPFIDELRIANIALSPSQFLIGNVSLEIPEPHSLLIWSLLPVCAVVAWRGRCGRTR